MHLSLSFPICEWVMQPRGQNHLGSTCSGLGSGADVGGNLESVGTCSWLLSDSTAPGLPLSRVLGVRPHSLGHGSWQVLLPPTHVSQALVPSTQGSSPQLPITPLCLPHSQPMPTLSSLGMGVMLIALGFLLSCSLYTCPTPYHLAAISLGFQHIYICTWRHIYS